MGFGEVFDFYREMATRPSLISCVFGEMNLRVPQEVPGAASNLLAPLGRLQTQHLAIEREGGGEVIDAQVDVKVPNAFHGENSITCRAGCRH